MSLRRWVKRLEREAAGEMLAIPQQDGTVKTFPASELPGAFLANVARLRATALGEQPPPEHPLVRAARGSTDARLRDSFFGGSEAREPSEEVEDLSE